MKVRVREKYFISTKIFVSSELQEKDWGGMVKSSHSIDALRSRQGEFSLAFMFAKDKVGGISTSTQEGLRSVEGLPSSGFLISRKDYDF